MQNQVIATENNQPAAISVQQQNTVPDNGQVMSLSNGPSLPQQMVDPQAHALMVPVTFENYHPAIRLRMAAGLNLPPRFVNEAEKQNGYNVPCLLRHPLALRPNIPPLVGECGYALPPHVISENGVQPIENSAMITQSLPPASIAENIPQPLLTHNGQPIAVRLPLPPDNHPQLNPYRSPVMPNEPRGSTPGRRPGSPEIDSRIPPRFVRLEGTNFSGLRGNVYRRREDSKDFQSGSADS